MNEQGPGSGLISRGEEPPNLEMPFARLSHWITPNEQFYVRCHFPVPQINQTAWRLNVEGAVAETTEFSLEQLRELPVHTIVATMECAGNGRSFLEPKVKGVAWDNGAVGTARWTGVLLRDLLAKVSASEAAAEVILEGADRGAIKEAPKPPGEIHYARSVPMAKAQGDVLLAYAMNDEPLTPEHGFPVRAVVPGWFGMASVKWLQRIVVTETPFHGYYQSIDYTYWERREQLPTLLPLAEMQVKAQIARPAMDEVVPVGATYRVHGAAWAADADVVSVEISADGGEKWAAAKLVGEPVKNAWRFWEYEWKTPAAPTRCTLIARATDSAGRTQPRERIVDYGTYMVNHWLPVKVEVS
ncbi:MAG: sulfite oxidase [Verrucomicrobiota bacterium]|nr:sulfite oxidase [Verrucomicrobiota bacterium]